MKSVLFALLLLPTLSTCVCAQNIDINNNRVVAASGLNLRNAPGLHGAILASIPMDSVVQILDNCDYGKDTVGTIPNFLEVYDPTVDSFRLAPLLLEGAWVKVAYQQDTGFLFNAYLYHYELYELGPEDSLYLQPYLTAGIKGDYLIFQPGYELFAPIQHHNDYHWYGIFGREGQYHLKAMSLEYVVSHHQEHSFLNLVPGETKDLVYIIGSKRPMPEHPFSGQGFDGELDFYGPYDTLKKQIINYPFSISPDTTSAHSGILDTWLQDQGQQQSLNIPALFPTAHPLAVGDIDGDGRPDVLTFHDGELGHVILQLSREAPAGKLVQPVAEELMGDCC